MQIIITGTPGTGKTTLAKALARKLKHLYLNEHEFCRRKGIGRFDKKARELVVPIARLEKALRGLLKKEKNLVLEGHLLCEARLPVDAAVALSCGEKELEKRLRKQGYNEEKILDNLCCEALQYCWRRAKKNFAGKALRVDNSKGIKKSLPIIIRALKNIQRGRID